MTIICSRSMGLKRRAFVIALAAIVCFAASIALASAQRQDGTENQAESFVESAEKSIVDSKGGSGKEGTSTRVQAEGKQKQEKEKPNGTKEFPKILPSPEEKIAPVETEKIDKAGERISKKIDELENRIPRRFGQWIAFEVAYGITWLKLITFLLALLLVAAFDRFLKNLIRRRLEAVEKQHREYTWREAFLEALRKPLSLFVWIYGTYGALSIVLVGLGKVNGIAIVRSAAAGAADFAGTFAVLWFLFRLVNVVDLRLNQWAVAGQVKADVLVSLVGRTLRVLIVLLGGIILLQNVTGIEIGPLVASLGLGGLAIALAAKESIANFFGTLTIIFDKPFALGDRIVVDKYDGMVERIGFRSTLLRTFEGHLISIPNEKAISAGVENIGRRPFLRWHTNITVTYNTPPGKVEEAVAIIRETLDNHEGMEPDYPPRVFFNGFNESSLNIEVFAWYFPASDYWKYQAWLQETCLRIMRRFEEEGIEFAFPTRTIFLASDDKKQLKLEMLKETEFDPNRSRPEGTS